MLTNYASRWLAITALSKWILVNSDDVLTGGSFGLWTGGQGEGRNSEGNRLRQSCLVHLCLHGHQIPFQFFYFPQQIGMWIFPALLQVKRGCICLQLVDSATQMFKVVLDQCLEGCQLDIEVLALFLLMLLLLLLFRLWLEMLLLLFRLWLFVWFSAYIVCRQVGVSLNEYFIELNQAKLKILNQFLNWIFREKKIIE